MLLLLWAGLLELSVRVLLVVSPWHLPVLGDATDPLVPSLAWEGTLGPFRSWSPSLGWENEPGVHARVTLDGSPWPSETIEPTGARRTQPVSLARVPGVRRVVAVGDSFLYGMEVGDDDVFTAVAERELPGWEILNYGVPGYGQDQALLQLRQRGLPLHPDVVVFGHVPVDMDRNSYDFMFARKPRFLLGEQGLVLTGVPVPDRDAMLEADRRRIKTLDALGVLARQTGWVTSDPVAQTRLSEAILRAVVTESREAGAVPVLVFMAAGLATPSARYAELPSAPFDTVCESMQVTCVDLRPAFDEAAGRGERLIAAQHWSPAGHRIAADALKQALTNLAP
jgi:hypothetical protein